MSWTSLVPHLEEPPTALAADGEGLREDLVQGLPLGQPSAEFGRLLAEALVGEGLIVGSNSLIRATIGRIRRI